MSARFLPLAGVYTAESRIGRGVFAAGDFAPGEALFTSQGELLNLEEVLKRGETAANAFQMDRNRYFYPENIEGRLPDQGYRGGTGMP